MKPRQMHPWQVDYREAAAIQEDLKKRLVMKGPDSEVRLIAGADVSYSKKENKVYAAVVVLRRDGLEEAARAYAVGPAPFPYIPGLLSFREAPVLLKAFERINEVPDAAIFDGQGIAHPRGLGLASHLGLFLDIPSIGCAKKKLIGEYKEPGNAPGDRSPLMVKDEVVGCVLRTKRNVKPVFVSQGHKVDLDSAVQLVMDTCRGYRLPEPTRRAHILVNQLRASAPQEQLTLWPVVRGNSDEHT